METRWIHSQEGHRVEFTGEVQDSQTQAHLEAYQNGGVGGEKAHTTGSTWLKIGSGGEH